MKKAHWLPLCISTLLLAAAPPAHAWQTSSAEEYYGRGVHHYFSGCYHCAEESLTFALSWDADDPRPYYFRALARLRTGQEFAAREDMQLGAELEAQSRGQFSVGRALERVQGPDRLLLEKYRRQARQAHDLNRALLDRARRDQMRPDGGAVERRRVAVPLEGLTGEATADVFAPEDEPRRPEPIELQPPVTPAPAQPEAPPADTTPAPPVEEGDPFLDDPLDGAPAPGPAAPPEADSVDESTDTPEEDFGEDPFTEEEDPFAF